MKTTQLISQAITGVSALLAAAFAVSSTAMAAPSVSFYGFQVDTPEWRSTSVPKVITLAGYGTQTDADAHYGTDGWIMPGSNSLPAYVASFTPPTVLASGYEPIDDPSLPVAATVDNVTSGLAYATGGLSAEIPLYTVTLASGVPSSFLMGVAFGNLPLDQNTYLGASFRVTVGDSTTGQVGTIENNGLVEWIFFKVEGASAGDVITLYGTTSAITGFTDLAAISFDPVPAFPVAGGTWDLAADFSTANNPSGTWTYGYGTWGLTTFTSLPQANDILAQTGLNGWARTSDAEGLPIIARNTTASPLEVYGSVIPPSAILLHPDTVQSEGDIAIVRWTVPATGSYNISARWDRLNPDPNISFGLIYKNLGGTPELLFSRLTTVADPSIYLGTGIPFTAGDTIDFMVYTGDDVPNTDGVALNVLITGGVVGTPTLTITRDGSNVRLAWPTWATTSTLESSTTLQIGSFAPAGLTVVTEGAEFAAYEALIPAGKKFYRLATP
jgi:hypothetical protein